MNYFTEIATWIIKCTLIAYYCVPSLRSPASVGILRWRNASDQKLEVGKLRSPASYYTLTTARQSVVAVVCRHLSSVTLCIVAKRCVQEKKLLLTAYIESRMRNRFSPN